MFLNLSKQTKIFILLALGFLFSWPGQISYVGYAVSIVLMLVTLFLPIRVVPFVLLVLFLGTDIVQTSSEILVSGEKLTGSPWRLWIGPISPGIFMMLIYLAFLLRLGKTYILPGVRTFLIYAFGMGIVGCLLRILINGELGVPFSFVVSDLRMIVFFLLSTTIFYT